MAKLAPWRRDLYERIVAAVEAPTTETFPEYIGIDGELQDSPDCPEDEPAGWAYRTEGGEYIREADYRLARDALARGIIRDQAQGGPINTEVEPARKHRGPRPMDRTLLAVGSAVTLRMQDPTKWTQEVASAEAGKLFGVSEHTVLPRLKEYEKEHGSPPR